MTQSQRIAANIGALRETTNKALDLLTKPATDASRAELERLEAKHAWLTADGPDALPTSVWFDLPPNEWWEAN